MLLRNLFSRTRPVSVDQVMQALSLVIEPEVNRDLVSLGLVKNVSARGGTISFTVILRDAGSPVQVPIERRARKVLSSIPGVHAVNMTFETAEKSELRDTSKLTLDAKHVIAVASGKGGVGKSTVAVSLSVAFAQMGRRVGLLDGDIHGPNVPMMMGLPAEAPIAFGARLFPMQAHGISVMSMGMLVPTEAPVIWRGPMMHQAIRQLLRDVMWGQLDILVVDLPPGTGDVQLTLVQSLPMAGVVLVTTPQDVASADVIKGGLMFRQLDVPILGLIENMSFYQLPNGERDHIFGEGGGARLARKLNVSLLSQIPIESAVSRQGDAGVPVVVGAPESAPARAIAAAARSILDKLDKMAPTKKPAAMPKFVADPTLNVLSN